MFQTPGEREFGGGGIVEASTNINGGRCGYKNMRPLCIEFLWNGKIDVKPLVTHMFGFSQHEVEEASEISERGWQCNQGRATDQYLVVMHVSMMPSLLKMHQEYISRREK